jgi:hypothetical protein
VGEYRLSLTKEGYHDYAKYVVIEPDRLHVEAIQMKRTRTKWWWISRGAFVATGAVITYFVLRDTGEGTEVGELPDPPGPP